MNDADRIHALKAALVRLYSQALIECAADGNRFDEMVRDVAGDALAQDLIAATNAKVEAAQA